MSTVWGGIPAEPDTNVRDDFLICQMQLQTTFYFHWEKAAGHLRRHEVIGGPEPSFGVNHRASFPNLLRPGGGEDSVK